MPGSAFAQRVRGYANLLVLVELKGGNDGLNTVVPYADGEYYALRPRIAHPARPGAAARRSARACIPSLEPLMPLWKERELAVVQGVGYPGRQPVAFPLDRDLGHGVEEQRVSVRRLARARVRGRAHARARSPPTA